MTPDLPLIVWLAPVVQPEGVFGAGRRRMMVMEEPVKAVALSPDSGAFINTPEVRVVQPLNALAPMIVATGKLMVLRPVQFLNPLPPILVAAGRLMVLKTLHCRNALAPIPVAAGRLTVAREAQALNAPAPMFVAAGRVIVESALVANALIPMLVAAGRDTVVRLVHCSKA